MEHLNIMKVDLLPLVKQSLTHNPSILSITRLSPGLSFFTIQEKDKAEPLDSKIQLTIENRSIILRVPDKSDFPQLKDSFVHVEAFSPFPIVSEDFSGTQDYISPESCVPLSGIQPTLMSKKSKTQL